MCKKLITDKSYKEEYMNEMKDFVCFYFEYPTSKADDKS